MCHVEDFRFISPPSRRSTSGPYRWAQRQMVGRMVDRQAALCHQFFKVSQAQAEPAVSPDAGHDDVRLELSLPEQRWTAGPHGVTLPNSQLQHFLSQTTLTTLRPLDEFSQ